MVRLVGGTLCILCMGGLVYGYVALLPQLVAVGTYSSLCTGGGSCSAQSLRFGLMYTLAVVAMSVCGPLWGVILDRAGGRVALALGTAASAGAMAALGAGGPDDVTFAAFIVLGAVAPLIYMSVLGVSKAYPAYTARLNALFTGVYDLSALVFFGFQVRQWCR